MSAKIPLTAPDLRGKEADYLAACVRDNWVSSAGPFVTEFEQRIAVLAGRKHAVATMSGTAALHLALMACGVRPGDRVIVPDWTFAATANAVFHCGARPIFVDIVEDSWALDPELVRDALAGQTGAPISAVIAVDPLGQPADMDPLCDVCADAGVPILEDAAGAIGASYKGRPVGAIGDIATFSFNGNKTVTAGGGGAIVTDQRDWADTARHLSTQARAGVRYEHDAVGFNYRMTNVNAAIGLAQLERLDDMIAAKRRIANAYDAALEGRRDLTPMPRRARDDGNCWLYATLCETPEAAERLVGYLIGRGIEARVFWQSLSAQPPYSQCERVLRGISESISGRVVALPSGSQLTADQQERVIAALLDWS